MIERSPGDGEFNECVSYYEKITTTTRYCIKCTFVHCEDCFLK